MSLTYSIGDAANAIGVSAETLRLWERRGLIQPARTSGGFRRYTDADLALLRRIRYLRNVERLNPAAISRLLQSEHRVGRPAPHRAASTGTRTIGDRMRLQRTRIGLTLSQVAEQAGVSISHLSAIERDVSIPSITTLHALMTVYGMTVRDLLSGDRDGGRLVRASERPMFPSSGAAVRIEQLALGPIEMEPQIFHVTPGAGSEGAYQHQGEEFIFVLRGVLEVWLDEDEHYQLRVGDCLYFPSTIAHRWWNPGEEEAELLWVNTPPTF